MPGQRTTCAVWNGTLRGSRSDRVVTGHQTDAMMLLLAAVFLALAVAVMRLPFTQAQDNGGAVTETT